MTKCKYGYIFGIHTQDKQACERCLVYDKCMEEYQKNRNYNYTHYFRRFGDWQVELGHASQNHPTVEELYQIFKERMNHENHNRLPRSGS